MFIGFLLGIFASVLFYILKGFQKIDEGHVGVVECFGKFNFSVKNAGLCWLYPWERIHQVSIKERMINLSGKSSGQLVMVEDGTVLRVDSKLRFRPQKNNLRQFLVELRNPMEHIQGLFSCLIRNEMANFKSSEYDFKGGAYAYIRQERKLLNNHLEQFCREKIGGKYGVLFDAVDLVDVLPPHELEEALNAIHHAHTAQETLFARAEAECNQRVLSAERGVEIGKSNAQSIEKEILVIGSHLEELKKAGTLKDYISRRKIEVESESKLLFIN